MKLSDEELAAIRTRDAQWTGGNPICKSCLDVRQLLAHVADLTAELSQAMAERDEARAGYLAGLEVQRDQLQRIEALEAELAAMRAGVPDGWRLVPVEPTEEMLSAGVVAALQQYNLRPWCPPCYRAMLAAAPQPPAGPTILQAVVDAAEDASTAEDEELYSDMARVAGGVGNPPPSMDEVLKSIRVTMFEDRTAGIPPEQINAYLSEDGGATALLSEAEINRLFEPDGNPSLDKAYAEIAATNAADADAGGHEELFRAIEGGHVPPAQPVADTAPLEIGYTNWRGEWSMRRIKPISVRYGSTEWHPEPGWLLLALDVDKGENREFAIKDFGPKAQAVAHSDHHNDHDNGHAVAMRVKPLAFDDKGLAASPFGRRLVQFMSAETVPYGGWGGWKFWDGSLWSADTYESREVAIAAAQANEARRILSAIDARPEAAVKAEALREWADTFDALAEDCANPDTGVGYQTAAAHCRAEAGRLEKEGAA